MTEPADQPSETPDPPTETPTAQQPPVPPNPQAPPMAGQPYAPGYFAPYPFAPVVKEPWFNPAKRTTILIASIVAALILLGSGALIGAVASHHRDRERGYGFYGPMEGPRMGPVIGPRLQVPGYRPGRGNGNGNGPGGPATQVTPSTGSTGTS